MTPNSAELAFILLQTVGFVVTPGGCTQIRWSVEGIKSIYIDGAGRIGWGEESYCPSADASGPQIEITAQDGTNRTFLLEIVNIRLHDAFQFLIVLLLGLIILAAVYSVAVLQPDEAPPVRLVTIIVLTSLPFAALMAISGSTDFINLFLGALRDVFVSPSWQVFRGRVGSTGIHAALD